MRSQTRQIHQALKANDIPTANRLMESQLSTSLQSLLREEMMTGEPAPLFNRTVGGAHPEVIQSTLRFQQMRRLGETDRVLQDQDWGSVQAYADSIVERYKARNGADRVNPRPGMTEQEMLEMANQFEPVKVDPNEIATMRQRLVKIDQAMKPYGMSVFTDSRTSRTAKLIAREEGEQGGLVQSQEQSELAHMGLPARALAQAQFGVEAAGSFMSNIGFAGAAAIERLGHLALDGLTVGDAAAYYNPPTSWAQDKDGQWYHNGGKVGGAEQLASLWHSLTSDFVDRQLAEYSDVSTAAQMHAAGLEKLVTQVSTTIGAIVPFAALSGPFMAGGGGLALRGLGWLATGGRAAVNAERAAKIMSVITGTATPRAAGALIAGAKLAGASAGLGTFEAMANGNIDGYGAAFWHGAMAAPVLMLLGGLGNGAGRLLNRTAKIPMPVARTLGGALEGAGFVVAMPETAQLVWDFAKDPTKETWAALSNAMVVNMMAMGVVKGAGGHGPADEALVKQSKATTGEDSARVAAEGGMDAETHQRHGDLMRRAEVLAGKDPEGAKAALAEAQRLEDQLRVQRAGLDQTRGEALGARREARERLHQVGTAEEGEGKYEAAESLMSGQQPSAGGEPPKGGAFADLRLEARQEREARVREERQAGEQPVKVQEGERRFDPVGSSEMDLLPSKVRDRIMGEENAAKRAQMFAEYQRTSQVGPGEKIEAPESLRGKPEREVRQPRERFLAEGTDPLESPRFRDLPPDLQRQVLDAPDARARRAAVLDWKPSREVTEDELQALGAGPAAEEAHEGSPAEAPKFQEMRTAPPGPKAGQPASQRMSAQLEMKGVPGTESIRQTDVIRDMEGYEGDPVRTTIGFGVGIRGRHSTKGLLGWFRTFQNLIRIHGKEGENLAIAAHEWSHAMHKAMDNPALDPAEHAALLRAADKYYPGFKDMPADSQLSEAWAEFWARWLLDDPILRNETTPFFQKAMSWLASNPDLLAQMNRINASLGRWRDQGQIERDRSSLRLHSDKESAQQIRARTGGNTPMHKAVAAVRSFWREFANQMSTDTYKLHQVELEALTVALGSKEAAAEALKKGGLMMNPARLLDALRMTGPRITERFLDTGTTNLAGDVTGEGLRQIFADVRPERYAEFMTWMKAMHSLELLDRKKITDQPREGHLYTAEQLELRHPDFRKIADRLRAWNDRLLDYGREAGLFSDEDVARITGTTVDPETGAVHRGYQFYIPFNRVIEDLDLLRSRRGNQTPSTTSGLHRIKGSSHLEIQDPLQSMADMAKHIIFKSHEAMVMKSMVKFGLIHENVGGFVTEVARNRIPDTHPIVQLANAFAEGKSTTLKQIGETMQALIENGDDLGGAITLWSQQQVPKGGKPIIAFRPLWSTDDLRDIRQAGGSTAEARDMEGKLLWLEVDPEAFARLKGVDVPANALDGWHPFVQTLLQVPATVARAGNVALSPAFWVRDAAANAVADAVLSKRVTPFGTLQSMARMIHGAIDLRRGTPDAELWKNLGGGGGGYLEGEARKGRVSADIAGTKQGLLAWTRRAIGEVGEFGTSPEQGLRIREMATARDAALKAGKTKLEANLLGLEAGKQHIIDLTRGGAFSRQYNSITSFFKAPINAAAVVGGAAFGFHGPAAAARFWMRGIAGLTSASLALWWMNKDEKWYQELTEDQRMRYWWFRFPGMQKAIAYPKREVGAIFGSLPEAFLDHLTAEHPLHAGEVASAFLGQFLPNNWLPNVLAPVVDWKTNTTPFSDRPTVPQWMQEQRVPRDQVMPYTRWYAKMLGDAFGLTGYHVSPAKLDQAIDSFTGGVVGRGEDFITDVRTLGGLVGEGQVPVFGRAFLREPMRTSRSVEDLYTLRRDLAQRHGSGELNPRSEGHRLAVQRATEQISEIHKNQRAGHITRQQADERAADIARQTLQQVQR